MNCPRPRTLQAGPPGTLSSKHVREQRSPSRAPLCSPRALGSRDVGTARRRSSCRVSHPQLLGMGAPVAHAPHQPTAHAKSLRLPLLLSPSPYCTSPDHPCHHLTPMHVSPTPPPMTILYWTPLVAARNSPLSYGLCTFWQMFDIPSTLLSDPCCCHTWCRSQFNNC